MTEDFDTIVDTYAGSSANADQWFEYEGVSVTMEEYLPGKWRGFLGHDDFPNDLCIIAGEKSADEAQTYLQECAGDVTTVHEAYQQDDAPRHPQDVMEMIDHPGVVRELYRKRILDFDMDGDLYHTVVAT